MSSTLTIDIPIIEYITESGTIHLWAELKFAGRENDVLMWKLSRFGEEKNTYADDENSNEKLQYSILNINNNAELPEDIIMPIDKQIKISIDSTGMITRTQIGNYPENFTWVIRLNGETVLERNADNELKYRYYKDWKTGEFMVFLKQSSRVEGYTVVSNIITYDFNTSKTDEEPEDLIITINNNAELPEDIVMPIDKQIEISIDSTGMITRTQIGSYPEDLTWVIRLNGETVLERNADHELKYRYYRNWEIGEFMVFLKRNNKLGGNIVVSNIITYISANGI